MRNDDTSSSFLSRWMRPQRASAAQDPAELGTAFGLDLSMESGLPQPVAPVPASAGGRTGGDGWLARWRRRG